MPKFEVTSKQVQSIMAIHRSPLAVTSFDEMEVKGYR